jgi:AraC-like DNA-binding protein
VNSRLKRIKDWAGLAQRANYCAETLAQQLGFSRRQLTRFLKEEFGKSSTEWLNELRQQRAMELVSECRSVKELADKLGYKQASHFSREFHKYHGFPPGYFVKGASVPQKVPYRYEMSHIDTRFGSVSGRRM